MTPIERYLFTLANVNLPPAENPTEVDIEVVGWATDWPSVQLQLRIAGFLNQLFSRVGALEAQVGELEAGLVAAAAANAALAARVAALEGAAPSAP